MNASKIQLSAEEMQLVTSSDWILTKHRIIQKVYVLFGQLSEQMQALLSENQSALPTAIFLLSPKIAKGEQYEALPWVVLDYPRVFSKEEVMAVRSFFWWGHYFSITLHLKGKFLQQYYPAIKQAAASRQLQGFYFSDTGNEFNFNLEGKNYSIISAKKKGAALPAAPAFLKISYKIDLAEWHEAEQKLFNTFQHFIQILKA